MNSLFYGAAGIAVLSTIAALTRLNAVRALLYFVVSLLSVAVIFYGLGAPFSAALEVIIYAGAILVLFVFAVMVLDLGPNSETLERKWLNTKVVLGPAVLTFALLLEVLFYLPEFKHHPLQIIGAKEMSVRLFGTYGVCVELGSILLLAALIGALHLGAYSKTGREIS